MQFGPEAAGGDLENDIVEGYALAPNFAASPPLSSFSPFTTEPLKNPEDLAFLKGSPDLIVTNSGASDVLEYDTSVATGSVGTTLIAPGSNGLINPQGVTVGADGNIYVSSTKNNEVLEFNASGAFISLFVRSGAGGLKDPQGLVFDPGIGLLVVSHDTGLVLLYNTVTGAFIREFTPEPLVNPQGMTFDSTSDLYVASHDTNRVLEYDTTGNFLQKFTSDDLAAPQGAVLGPDGNLYVASRDTNQILRYFGPGAGAAGRHLQGRFHQRRRRRPDRADRPGLLDRRQPLRRQLGQQRGPALQRDHRRVPQRVRQVHGRPPAPASSRRRAWRSTPRATSTSRPATRSRSIGPPPAPTSASSSTGSGGLSKAEGIAFSADTNFDASRFYVAELRHQPGPPVQRRRPATFIKVYAQTGTSTANNLRGPTGIAFGADGTLYVSSSTNSEVIRYQAATGSFLDVFVTSNRGGLSTPEGIW